MDAFDDFGSMGAFKDNFFEFYELRYSAFCFPAICDVLISFFISKDESDMRESINLNQSMIIHLVQSVCRWRRQVKLPLIDCLIKSNFNF